MTTERRQEVRRGLRGRIVLGKRLSRRALLVFPFPRGAAGAAQEPVQVTDAGEAVPAHQTSRAVRCGACGGYHGLTAEKLAGDPAGMGGDGRTEMCPVDAHQRTLARGFRVGHKAESPELESGTREEERGS
jgi:hypothetical protein